MTFRSGSTRDQALDAYLANEVRIFVLILLGNDGGTLPDGVVTFVSFPGLQLGDDVKLLLLLLLDVLVEGEGIILFFWLAIATAATFCGLIAFSRGSRSGIAGWNLSCTPGIGGWGSPAGFVGGCATGLNCSIGCTSILSLEFGVSFIAAPSLMQLLF